MELFCYTQNYAVSQGFQLKPSPSRKENPKPKKEKVTDFCTCYVLLLNLLLTWKRAPNWILLLNFLVVLVTKGQTLRDVWNWALIDIRQKPWILWGVFLMSQRENLTSAHSSVMKFWGNHSKSRFTCDIWQRSLLNSFHILLHLMPLGVAQ